jgi:phospholipid/cholesterol/gamma-HCH transport system substrate-binding protein
VDLADRLTQVFSDQNARSLRTILDNTRLASERLPNTAREAEGLVSDLRRTTQDVAGAAVDLRGVITRASPDVEAAVVNIRQVSDNLARTTQRLDRFVAANEPGLTVFAQQSLPEFEQLLRESREAARDFRELSRSLKQNPSQLIYESAYRGVQVPR